MPMTYQGQPIKPISRNGDQATVELPNGTRHTVHMDAIQFEADIQVVTKTAGQLAYEADYKITPTYPDGGKRATWEQLDSVAKWSWERNPTPRGTRQVC